MVTDQLLFVFIALQPRTVCSKKLNTMLGASSNTEIAPRLWPWKFLLTLRIWWFLTTWLEISFMRLVTPCCTRILRQSAAQSPNAHWWIPPADQFQHHLAPISGRLSVALHGLFQPREVPLLDGAPKHSATNAKAQHKLDLQKILWLAGL